MIGCIEKRGLFYLDQELWSEEALAEEMELRFRG